MLHIRSAAKRYKMQFDVLPTDKPSAVVHYLTAISPQRTEHISFAPIFPFNLTENPDHLFTQLVRFLPVSSTTFNKHFFTPVTRHILQAKKANEVKSVFSLRKDIACLRHCISVRLLCFVGITACRVFQMPAGHSDWKQRFDNADPDNTMSVTNRQKNSSQSCA